MRSAHVGAMSSSTCFPSLPRPLRPSFTKTKSSPKFSMSMRKDPVREWILSEGKATEITKISPVGGGCINLASRYDTDAGSFFVETNRYSTWEMGPSVFGFVVELRLGIEFFVLNVLRCFNYLGPSMFEAEALGLGAMYETGTIRIPKPYKVASLLTGGSCIIMEFIQFGAFRGYQNLEYRIANTGCFPYRVSSFDTAEAMKKHRTGTSEKHGAPVCQCGDRTMLTTWRPLEWKHQF